VSEHRSGAVPGFTRRHGVKLLVFVETHHGIEVAIERENPEWDDLAVSLLGFGPLPVPKPHHRHSGKGRDPRTRKWE
jgi:putative endonuclease